MQIRRALFRVSVPGLLVLSVAAQDRTVAAGDEAALMEAGKAAVRGLTPLPPGAKYTSYFDVKMGPEESVGYVIASLEAPRSGGEPVYRYSLELTFSFASNAQLNVMVNARLRADFEPLDIEVERVQLKPDGTRQVTVQRAAIGVDKVTLSTDRDGQQAKSESPRPESPFIYGIETLVQRIDYNKHNRFTIREFDMQTGGAGPLTFTTKVFSDGLPTIITRNVNGEASYQFWFDRDGRLIRWGEPSMPVLFVRTTKERAEKLKARFRK